MLAALGLGDGAGRPPAARRRSSRPATRSSRRARRCGPAAVYDSNAPDAGRRRRASSAASRSRWASSATTRRRSTRALRPGAGAATSCSFAAARRKGAGDLSYRVVAGSARPGIVAHGVALKPGKPLCLARSCDGSRWSILPGFPTSAIFTFHEFVAPVLRAPRRPAASARDGRRRGGCRSASTASRAGRSTCSSTSCSGRDGPASPTRWARARARSPRSAGRTASSSSRGRPNTSRPATRSRCRLLGRGPAAGRPGRHRQPLRRARLPARPARGRRASRSKTPGRRQHRRAWRRPRRGECDLAGVHLLDPATGTLQPPVPRRRASSCVPGYGRMQGVVFRPGDAALRGARPRRRRSRRALADPDCVHGQPQPRQRHARPDRPPARRARGRRATATEARSHNAVAAAVAQGRADWGVAIAPGGGGLRARLPAAPRNITISLSATWRASGRGLRPSLRSCARRRPGSVCAPSASSPRTCRDPRLCLPRRCPPRAAGGGRDARSRRSRAGAGGLCGRPARRLRVVRSVGDPVGDRRGRGPRRLALPRGRGERRRCAARRPLRDRRRGRAHRPLASGGGRTRARHRGP